MTFFASDLVIRDLNSVAELKRSEAFQCEVWGKDDPADNSDIMLALQHEGGLVAGAFVGERMLGFLFAFPTSQPNVQHSHRLGVHPDSQGMGLGLKLKWYQRDWCLARDITTVRWTYDPLRRINAGLNIAKLGATSGTYYQDYYGKMEGINAGVASDRLLVDWQLDAPNVVARAENRRVPDATSDLRVAIPTDFGALLTQDLQTAVAERHRVRDVLVAAFADGHRITGFDVKACEYVLSKS